MVSERIAKKNVYKILKSVGNNQIEFHLLNSESQVERDEYNSIVKSNNTNIHSLYAFPITISPTSMQREKVGILENCDIMLYLSKFEIDLKKLSKLDFSNIRGKFIYLDIEYNITESTLFSQFGKDFLYLIIAGHRK